MSLYHPVIASNSLKVLAHLLSYPDANLRCHLIQLKDALHTEKAIAPARLKELDALIENLSVKDELEVEENYVELFDRGRSTSLHLFEHVHGDSRDRGNAMIDLVQTYEKAGLFLSPDEMPDFLPVVLQFLSTQPPHQSRMFLGEMTHILNSIFNVLQKRNSAYASVLGALIELAGEKAYPVKIVLDEPIDCIWEEPTVFDGCSIKGQALPDQIKPIHFTKKFSDVTKSKI